VSRFACGTTTVRADVVSGSASWLVLVLKADGDVRVGFDGFSTE